MIKLLLHIIMTMIGTFIISIEAVLPVTGSWWKVDIGSFACDNIKKCFTENVDIWLK